MGIKTGFWLGEYVLVCEDVHDARWLISMLLFFAIIGVILSSASSAPTAAARSLAATTPFLGI